MDLQAAEVDHSAPTGDGHVYPPMRTGVFACVLLFLASMLSLLDRQILSLLVEPIKADLGLSDVQISLLQGLAFALLYATSGLFLGYLVDKFSRRNLIIVCLSTWSAATMSAGLATNFLQLFLARVGVGVGEAAVGPASHSLLCDYFAPRHRGRAFAAIGVAGNMGMAFALLGGAAIYRWISDNMAALGALGRNFEAWQITFMVAGAPGLVLAAVFLLLREPARQATVRPADLARPSIMLFLKSRKRTLGLLIAHFSFYQLMAYAVVGWTAAYYMRRFGASVFDAGIATGVIVVIGAAGSVVTGMLGDKWIQRRAFGGRLQASVVSFALAIPGLLLCYLVDDMTLSIVGGIVAWMGLSITMTTAPLTLADITPHEYRGRIASIYLLITSMFGIVTGPFFVASVTDYILGDERLVNYSILIVTLPSVVLSTVCALLVMKAYTRELYGPESPLATA